jgi:hypothetical protein
MSEKQYDFPTEVIDLPSEGKVYPLDNPLSSGKVTLKYMTAKEEDILSSQNLIKKGVVLDKLFESIIVDDVNIDDITIGDKNAIILATRVLGYGPEYPMNFYSTHLGEETEAIVHLSKVKTKEVDLSQFHNKNEFEFTTPTKSNKLTFKLLTHGDEKAIEKDIAALEKFNKDTAFDITTRLKFMIISVDGNSEVGVINKYASNMLVRDSRAFRNYVKKIQPDMDMVYTHIHSDGEEEEVPITLGVNFFWPGEES